MGLFVENNGPLSELQSKVIADLQQKIHQTANDEGETEVEPRLLENQHTTRPAGIIISLLVVALVVLVVWLIASQS